MTEVTREIVKDLLPLYVAGEASPDSCAAVEDWLRRDAELARFAEALRSDGEPVPALAVTPAAARAALATTKALLRRRARLLASALFFTGLPLSFVADESGVRFLMLRDAPLTALACLTVACVLWVAFGFVARRLRVTGL